MLFGNIGRHVNDSYPTGRRLKGGEMGLVTLRAEVMCFSRKMSGLRRGELSENSLFDHGYQTTYQLLDRILLRGKKFLVPGNRPALLHLFEACCHLCMKICQMTW